MTESEFELFDIQCSDFIRNIQFFAQQSKDPYVQASLEFLIHNVRYNRRVIAETLDIETV